MTREQLVDNVAKLVAGLQVPASISHQALGAAYDPWCELLHEANGGFGWTTADQCREAFTKILGGTDEFPAPES